MIHFTNHTKSLCDGVKAILGADEILTEDAVWMVRQAASDDFTFAARWTLKDIMPAARDPNRFAEAIFDSMLQIARRVGFPEMNRLRDQVKALEERNAALSSENIELAKFKTAWELNR